MSSSLVLLHGCGSFEILIGAQEDLLPDSVHRAATFTQSDLEAVKDLALICEVGLLQATPSILSDGRTVYYNFIHLSIQESSIHLSHANQ